MLISVHIPKTAGSSFRAGLKDRFGERLLLDYGDGPVSGSVPARWRRLRNAVRVRWQAESLLKEYDVVHGHFVASKYSFLETRVGLCAFFRDPVERIVSAYRYSSRNRRPGTRFHREQPTLEQYAAWPRQRGIYRLFTAGVPLERFAFIGLTEEYETSLELFREIFGVGIPCHQRNRSDEELDSDAEVCEAVRSAQRANYRMYDAARRRFDSLCSQYL